MNQLTSLIRKLKRLNISDVCSMTVGVSRRTVYAIRSGECENPRIQTIEAIEKGIRKHEAERAKKFSKAKVANMQSRDKRRASVAGKRV